jgi:hypothetical protein
MFGNRQVISIDEIIQAYKDEWVAITVEETDDDGFAIAGEILAHGEDERFVWSAIKLGEIEAPIYVFHTSLKKAA